MDEPEATMEKKAGKRGLPPVVVALIWAFCFFLVGTFLFVFISEVNALLVYAISLAVFLIAWPLAYFFRFMRRSHEVEEVDDPIADYKLSVKNDRLRHKRMWADINRGGIALVAVLFFFFCTALPTPLGAFLKSGVFNFSILFLGAAIVLVSFIRWGIAAYILNHMDWIKCGSFKQQITLIDKQKDTWRKRGITIKNEQKTYVNKISLYKEFLYLAESNTEVETMLAFIAIDKGDFLEKGTSAEETKVKWWPILLGEMDRTLPYDFLRHEVEERQERLNMEL
jgi:hypothetical protein